MPIQILFQSSTSFCSGFFSTADVSTGQRPYLEWHTGSQNEWTDTRFAFWEVGCQSRYCSSPVLHSAVVVFHCRCLPTHSAPGSFFGRRPARLSASRSRWSICALTDRRSSLAHRWRASSNAGSTRSRKGFRTATSPSVNRKSNRHSPPDSPRVPNTERRAGCSPSAPFAPHRAPRFPCATASRARVPPCPLPPRRSWRGRR